MRILLIEDDAILAEVLVQALATQHYVVDVAEDGRIAWEYAQDGTYDLLLMDVGLPKLDGISLCQRLRSEGCSTPILLMTAKDASDERIRGLDAGADDYLIKPLDLKELQARVRALLRRGEVARSPILAVGSLRLDPSTCQVTYNDKLLALTPKEYSLLELFLRNPERVFSRGQIVEHLWTFDDPPQEESVKAHIKGLRQKLKAAGAVDWIENVYGIGYRLKQGLEVGEQVEEPEADREKRGMQSSIPDVERQQPIASIEQQFHQKLKDLWIQHQGAMVERLAILQQAAAAVQAQTLSRELQEAAERAAHKLAGVLGMFDREAGTVMARDVEHLLQAEALSLAQAEQLRSRVQELSHLIQAAASEQETSAPPPKVSSSSENCTRLLVVDDDPVFLAALSPMLEPWGIHLTTLEDPLRFWEVLPAVAPDLLVLDVDMPQVGGIALCQAVRSHPDWQALPVLFLTAHREAETIQQVFGAGADDYITKPIVGAELLTRITNRLERIRLLQALSRKDPLTGLGNQIQSSRDLEAMLQAEPDSRGCFAVLQVAQLRQINRQYSHAAGNQVLQQWGRLLQSAFPNREQLGYWGNGEFVVGMPRLTQAEAEQHLANLLTTLRQQVFTAPEGDRFQAECHFAIAAYPLQGRTLRSLYQAASSILDARSC